MQQPTRVDVLPVQAVVAAASPSAWRDGLVTATAPAEVTVTLLDGSVTVLLTRGTPQPGEPVAVHPVAGLLAVGEAWFAARPTTDVAGSGLR